MKRETRPRITETRILHIWSLQHHKLSIANDDVRPLVMMIAHEGSSLHHPWQGIPHELPSSMTRDFHMNCRNLRNIDSYTQEKPMHVNTRTPASSVKTRTLKSFFSSEILDITFYPGKVVNWYIKTYGTKTNIEVRKSNSNNSETLFRKRTTKVVRCHWDPCWNSKDLEVMWW